MVIVWGLWTGAVGHGMTIGAHMDTHYAPSSGDMGERWGTFSHRLLGLSHVDRLSKVPNQDSHRSPSIFNVAHACACAEGKLQERGR